MAKILLVDDDSLLVRMYQKKLQNDGYEVQTASDGVEALNIASQFVPDVIILDIMMPKLNGIDTLIKLKEIEKLKNIPVVMLTNLSSSDAEAEKAIDLGAVTYLVKANNRPKDIVAKVKEILSGYVHEVPQVKAQINE